MPAKPVMSAMFFQADFVKGYRFWDETGLLANSFVGRFQAIDYRGDPRPPSLVALNPSDPADVLLEVRINPLNAWFSLRPNISWTIVRVEIERAIDYIARTIAVTQFSRLGLRINLLWGRDSIEEVVEIQRSRIMRVQDWGTVGEVIGGELVVNIKDDRLTARIAVSAVQNVQTLFATRMPGQTIQPPAPDVEQPGYAVLLDVDIVDNALSDSINVNPFLNRSIQMLEEKIEPYMFNLIEG